MTLVHVVEPNRFWPYLNISARYSFYIIRCVINRSQIIPHFCNLFGFCSYHIPRTGSSAWVDFIFVYRISLIGNILLGRRPIVLYLITVNLTTIKTRPQQCS